jgi:peptidoglycan/LPS O-acetylase OafA/YrhL
LNIKDFAKRRALRILPPYFAALALFSVIAWSAHIHSLRWNEAVGWKDVVSHALMLHNLWPSTFASINPAFWSLALEVQLYCVFPLLVWLATRRGLRAVALSTLVLAMAWQMFAFAKYGLSREWAADFAVAYHALPARCFEFALGMCAAAAVAHPQSSQVRIAGWLAAVLIAPALWFVLFVSRFGPFCDAVWGVLFASGVVLLSRVPQIWFLERVSLRAMTSLGTISYSVYLIHQPLIGLLAPEDFGLEVTGRVSLFTFAAVRLALVVGIGLGFYVLLERPFISRRTKHAPAVLPLPQAR